MDTGRIKAQYFTEHIRKGFQSILAQQRAIAANKVYGHEATRTDGRTRSRSHVLEHSLQTPDYTINPDGAGISASIVYPSYIRFLDMKRLCNYRIYNRPIWKTLYKQTLQDIRYEFSDWIRDNFGEEMLQCFKKSS